jgi:hypothetical protein
LIGVFSFVRSVGMKKKVKCWQYILIVVLFEALNVFFIFPELFETSSPVASVAFLPRAALFILLHAVQGAVMYRLTRG